MIVSKELQEKYNRYKALKLMLHSSYGLLEPERSSILEDLKKRDNLYKEYFDLIRELQKEGVL